MSEFPTNLKKEFLDEEYRYAYAEDFLNTVIATQIRVLREQRELTQQQLADLMGTKQAGVSRLENVNYSAWKTETLRKLARALKVRLKITFEDFTSLLDEANNFSRENLQRVEFGNDTTFQPLPIRRPGKVRRVRKQVRVTTSALSTIAAMRPPKSSAQSVGTHPSGESGASLRDIADTVAPPQSQWILPFNVTGFPKAASMPIPDVPIEQTAPRERAFGGNYGG